MLRSRIVGAHRTFAFARIFRSSFVGGKSFLFFFHAFTTKENSVAVKKTRVPLEKQFFFRITSRRTPSAKGTEYRIFTFTFHLLNKLFTRLRHS